MNESILREVKLLKTAIDTDPRIKKLNELEAKMSKDESVIKLSKQLKEKEEIYNSNLQKYGNKNPLTTASWHELYLSKKDLDSLPIVQEYNLKFIEVRDLYMQIDDILFAPYRKKILHINS